MHLLSVKWDQVSGIIWLKSNQHHPSEATSHPVTWDPEINGFGCVAFPAYVSNLCQGVSRDLCATLATLLMKLSRLAPCHRWRLTEQHTFRTKLKNNAFDLWFSDKAGTLENHWVVCSVQSDICIYSIEVAMCT